MQIYNSYIYYLEATIEKQIQVNMAQNPDLQQNHTLNADIATGWKPKMKIIGPMPLNFDNPYLDKLIKPLIYSETTPHQVIYLGLRPKDTFEMHSVLAKNYRYKYRHLFSSDYSHLKPFFKKFYSQFQPLCKMPFHGMNPRVNTNIIFESRFQSGNLDCVIRTRTNQYDLFLRIDSNTNGHIMWYYFKVMNSSDKAKTIRLNLCNLRRSQLFYDKCMKPYICRKGQWKQEDNNLKITEESIRFYKQHLLFTNDEPQQPKKYRKMGFDLQLSPAQQVEIAYSIPYTYTKLIQDIKNLKNEASKNQQINFDINLTNISLSGLQIPYIKIYKVESQTQKKEKEQVQKKKQILIIGRQHPGQACGSHVLKGFMEGLVVSNQITTKNLLNHFNFHFIPMLNPDGVVAGNFRTSLYGKDLNRLFRKNQTLMIPQVQFCKDIVSQITKNKKKKIFMFLDFHGHSVMKNAFCYAPSFFQTNSFEDIREFPKLISQMTEMFRYPSCSFRISTHKKSTARAVFCQDSNLCYTIETSNWSYYSQQTTKNILFDKSLWEKLGLTIIKSLGIFYNNILQRKAQKRKKKLAKLKNESTEMLPLKINKKIHLKTQQNSQKINKNESKNEIYHRISDKVILSPARSIKNRAISSVQLETVKTQILKKVKQQKNEFDEQEQQAIQINEDSDQSDEEDMQKQKFKKYIHVATQMFIQFEKIYYGNDYHNKARYQLPKKNIKKRQTPVMKLACLRQNGRSEKKTIQSQKQLTKVHLSEQKRFERNSTKTTESPIKSNNVQNLTKLNFIKNTLKQDTIKSLPRISVFNYIIPFEQNEEKKGIRIPKIQMGMTKRFKKLND